MSHFHKYLAEVSQSTEDLKDAMGDYLSEKVQEAS